MKNLKNIDRLFQEKFKHLETEPDEQTWLNIQAALKQDKKERRIIPIWFQYSGVAAVFLLGFFTLNTHFKTNSDTKKTIDLELEIVTTPSYSNDSIITKTIKNVKKTYKNNSFQITVTNDDEPKSTRKEQEQFSSKKQSKINGNKTPHKNSPTVYQKEHNRPLEELKRSNEEVNSHTSTAEKSPIKNAVVNKSILNQNSSETVLFENKDSKIATANTESKQSTTITTPNKLEELLKEKEGKKEQRMVNSEKNKWEIAPNIARMYLNTNSNGSAIDPLLSKNNKTADNGLSIGIGVNYALSKNITLRSGINAFSVGYNTNDVSYAAGLNTNSLANVNYTSTESIEIQNQATYNALNSFEKDLQKTSLGSINQKMGYYEVPLELSYTILNKKIGVNIIGGISTLFLNQNEISLVSTNSHLKLGEANNLNPVHFSTNFGFGFKYEFIKSFRLNFEPMIKYQLNSYSNGTSNYKPLFIGLYSGISYRF